MASFNPQETASLMGELYQVLVSMTHIPPSLMKWPPNKIDEQYCNEFDISPDVLEFLRILPYVDQTRRKGVNMVVMYQTAAVDYTTVGGLWDSRDPLGVRQPGNDKDPPYVDSWVVPLAIGRREGTHWMLDTKTGLITKWTPGKDVAVDEAELERNPPLSKEYHYRGYPTQPAAEMLREVIDGFKRLEWTPVSDDSIQYTPDDMERVEDLETEEYTVKRLYLECGWPDNFRPDEFHRKREMWLGNREDGSQDEESEDGI